MAVEVEIDIALLKSEIKKTYASVSTEPEKDFIFPTGRPWAEDLGLATVYAAASASENVPIATARLSQSLSFIAHAPSAVPPPRSTARGRSARPSVGSGRAAPRTARRTAIARRLRVRRPPPATGALAVVYAIGWLLRNPSEQGH
jgi:hypothetical protein